MSDKTIKNMCFSEALRLMKLGFPVQRAGWNGVDLWVSILNADKDTIMTFDYAYITYPNGDACPWVPSQSDMLAEDWIVNRFRENVESGETVDDISSDIIQHLNDGYRVHHKSWGPGRYIQRHSRLLDKVVYAGSDDEEANLDDYHFEKGAWRMERSYAQSERKDIGFHEIALYLNSGYIVRQKHVSCLKHLSFDENLKVCEVQNYPVVGSGSRSISEIDRDPSKYPRAFYRWETFKKGEIRQQKLLKTSTTSTPLPYRKP